MLPCNSELADEVAVGRPFNHGPCSGCEEGFCIMIEWQCEQSDR